jgi:bifunctional DNA primase/polymerase-like protein/primase-like protein
VTNLKKTAALGYAKRGILVFPCHSITESGVCTCSSGATCETPGKHPRTRNGFKDAITDERVIDEWWNKWPEANIGVPTGQASGRLALDIDPRNGGDESLAALVEEHGELPRTTMVKTGGGGTHYHFSYPAGEAIRCNSGKLGPGLDIKANGGFVIVPPSTTVSTYEWLDTTSPAEPPEWLLEAFRAPHKDISRQSSASPISPTSIGSDPIPEGTRDITLTKIAGRLHDGTRTLQQLFEELLTINEARCSPLLPEAQVWKIAESIHSRSPFHPSHGATQETLEALDIFQLDLEEQACSGRSDHTNRDFLLMLAQHGRRHSSMIPPAGSALPAGGVRVIMSVRAAALAAGISKRTAEKTIKRCKIAGKLRQDNAERGGADAGAFILVLPERAKVGHSTTSSPPKVREDGRSVLPLRALRLRWSAPDPDDPETWIRRLGKTRGRVIDYLEAGPATLEVLACRLGHKRPRDLRRRVLPPLIEAGIVEYVAGVYRLVEGYLEALARERERSKEIEAMWRDMARYDREREAYRRRHENKSDPVPTRREMDDRRSERENADGGIFELRPIDDVPELKPEESADLEAIRAYELVHGRGSFRWDQASSKRLFYSREGRGRWPNPEILERLQDYLAMTSESEIA